MVHQVNRLYEILFQTAHWVGSLRIIFKSDRKKAESDTQTFRKGLRNKIFLDWDMRVKIRMFSLPVT